MKVYSVQFDGVYPVGNCLIIAATCKEQALNIAMEKVTWQDLTIDNIEEVNISKPCVIEFLSGDY